MKFTKKKSWLFVLVFIILFIVSLFNKVNREFQYTKNNLDSSDAINLSDGDHKRIVYLENLISNLDKSNDFQKLGKSASVWQLFTLSFTSFAFTNIAMQDSSFTERAVKIIDLAIESSIKNKYGNIKFDNKLGVMWTGHTNFMIGLFRQLTDDNKYDKIHTELTKSLHNSIKIARFKNIETFKNSIWTADNAVALASIYLYDKSHNTDYSTLCSDWVIWVKENFIDETTNIIQTQLHPTTGESIDKLRGCSIAWSILFINFFDKEFAQDQYRHFLKNFYWKPFGFGVFKEYKDSFQTNSGNIDTGPMILGYGTSATIWGMGAAHLMNDKKTYSEINRITNLTGLFFEEETKNERKYKIFNPTSDAIKLCIDTVWDWSD